MPLKIFSRIFHLTAITAAALITLAPVAANSASLVPDINVVRPIDGKDGDFIIRLSTTFSMSGCFHYTKAEIEEIDAGAVMYIKIKEGELKMDESTSYDQIKCDLASGSAFNDIPLNKNELQENETYKIEIKSERFGKMFDIEIETDDHSITLNSELKLNVRGDNTEKEKKITHWFFPENTVIISTNDIEKDPEIKKQVKTIAGSRGLTPMNIVLDGFKPPEGHLFFVDTKNIMGESLNDTDTIVIGKVTTSEEYQGANGPYQKRQHHAVFARRPNTHD